MKDKIIQMAVFISVALNIILIGIWVIEEFDMQLRLHPEINGTAKVYLGGFEFIYNQTWNASQMAYTWENGTIVIDAGYAGNYRVCVHEVLHNYLLVANMSLEHEVIYSLENNIRIPVCDRLMEIAGYPAAE